MKKVLSIIFALFALTSCGIFQKAEKSQQVSSIISQEIPTPDPDVPEVAPKKTIEVSKVSAKTDDLSPVRTTEYDFNSDGSLDIITLYTNAENTEEDDFLWDDFHKWLLEVKVSDNEYYTLFNNSVSLGQLYFEIAEIYHNDDARKTVTTYLTTSSSLDVEQFIYTGGKFEVTTVYSSEDASTYGINRIFSSIPTY